jgi:hypothetical protein
MNDPSNVERRAQSRKRSSDFIAPGMSVAMPPEHCWRARGLAAYFSFAAAAALDSHPSFAIPTASLRAGVPVAAAAAKGSECRRQRKLTSIAESTCDLTADFAPATMRTVSVSTMVRRRIAHDRAGVAGSAGGPVPGLPGVLEWPPQLLPQRRRDVQPAWRVRRVHRLLPGSAHGAARRPSGSTRGICVAVHVPGRRRPTRQRGGHLLRGEHRRRTVRPPPAPGRPGGIGWRGVAKTRNQSLRLPPPASERSRSAH